ncbi:hypothetical protein Sjap_002712 [Stephania japonica]|uniref:Membralin n=1 Tax=Stephania japonica TaxID=461633 RepID=A0AAP0KMD0_9MAGN
MDPEQTFIRVQERFSQILSPRVRTSLEYIYLVVAIALFCVLVIMHANYVQQPGCSSELHVVRSSEAQLAHIKITSIGAQSQNSADSTVEDIGDALPVANNIEVPNVDGDGFAILGTKFWLNWIGSGARRSKLVIKALKTDNVELQPESSADISSSKAINNEKESEDGTEVQHGILPVSARKSFKAAAVQFCSKCHSHLSFFIGRARRLLHVAGANMYLKLPWWVHLCRLDKINLFAVHWLEKRVRSFEPTYLYTMEKGYFLLPEGAKTQHGIHTVNISISARHSCFGNRWQQLLINRFVGYDTILMNSLLSSPGQGYIYNYQTKEFYDLSYAHEPTEVTTRFGDYLVTKCGVLVMSLFVFFTTTMSVSFTLRETQIRMLKFTVQLEHHARHRLPTFQLIFVHVIESLVFVPIMIGILFFLFEFYDDQLLAFMVLILVWLCELFTLISVRTPISMKFFPRFFLLYFLVFHIYFFSYPYGFSYLAFAAAAVFMQHLILYFWNRFEVPALQRLMQSRRSQFPQPDIHITSSTILASTLHITRLNMRNPSPVNPGSPGPGMRSVPNQAVLPNSPANVAGGREATDTISHGGTGTPPVQFPELPQRSPTEAAQNPNSLNSFGSLLLWILGGASSEGLNSFLSLFRDARDQAQVYPESLQQEGPGT